MIRELAPDILLSAYAQGIFPMAGPDGEIGWYSPDPRAVIPLDGFRVSRSLRQRCGQGLFEIRLDASFREVILACADRPEGTWINEDIVEAYCLLHELGFAHSVESWADERLVGGLYGVSLGGAFFGESMFHRATDASKVALVHLVERMRDREFVLLDVQFMTPHLRRFGAVEIPRNEYLERLQQALEIECAFGD
ncbi:MAG: leucyl/phenylalanyl-tRNA--protein transferase [Phycisphaerae bacterium]|nr:leucyl/phenylalanyl-tRNA--protein transferase [Phycisphaerae bacterium]